MEGEASSFNAAQVAVLAQIASGAALPAALEAIVRLIEQQAGGMLCSVLLLDGEHGCLRHGAAPNLPRDYVAELDGSAIGPEAGSCGTAAFRGERVIVEDIATHPYWANYRHLALPHGLVACWSTPIFSPDRSVLGTFAMYYRERRAPTARELAWIDAATHLASIAIVRTRVEQRLRSSEIHARQLARLYAVSSSVSETLVRIRDPVQLYEVACRIAVEKAVAVLAWVGIHDQAEGRIVPVARAGIDDGYIDACGPHGGPAVRAIRTGTVAISNDIANDPTFDGAAEALRSGLGSCAAFPFRVDGSRRAVFVLYRDSPDSFADEIGVIAALADNISFAIESAENELERRRAEQALREREERLRLLHDLGEAMRSAGDAEQVLAVAVGMLGRHLRVSRCGYAEIDADGDRVMIAPDYTDGCASIAGQHRMADFGPEVAAALLRGGRAVVVRDVDAELRAGPGVERLKSLGVKASICCTLTRSGVPRAMMAVQHREPRDWTPNEIRIVEEVVARCWSMIEQRTAETKLSRNEALLRIAGHAARLGGWSIDLPDRRLTWSDEVCAIHEIPLGTTPSIEEALAFYAPEHRGVIRDRVRACARDGVPFDLELELVTAAARRVSVRAIGYAERNAAGVITRVHGAFQDISDRRHLEDQLRQAQKMEAVGRLASAVAHDFNNVLSVILSYSSFLLDSIKPADPIRGDIEEIQRAGDRAGQLTRQLLAFSRQQILEPRVVGLDRILSGLETMLRRLVGESVVLEIRTAATGNIVADPGQIEQVIMNLVVNARDAMPSGGNVTVATSDVVLDAAYATGHPGVAPGPYVALAVTDSGVGMDAATRSRMFEPFFTTKATGKGTGLGLATVYGIVSQSGGHIWVDSEPGRGAAFTVYFPRVDAAVEAELADEPPLGLRGTETIVVVEDDDQVRKITAATLRRAGYVVFEAPDASEAVRVSERYAERVHLLLTDVVMPRTGGRALAARLAIKRPDLRVLFASGYAQDTLVRDGALEPGVAFFAKPITPDALLRRIREVLGGAPVAGRSEPIVPELAAGRSARRSAPPSGGGRHVLHIDDEESLVLLTARILKRLGYQVSSFTDPSHALQAFIANPAGFDAVVTDVTMRRMTGFELVRAIWAIRPDIPVVVTSGDFRPEDIRTAETMRIRDLVVKPDTVEELGRVLHELFSRASAGLTGYRS